VCLFQRFTDSYCIHLQGDVGGYFTLKTEKIGIFETSKNIVSMCAVSIAISIHIYIQALLKLDNIRDYIVT